MLKDRENVIVSAVEPTGNNREKIWLQKSNNMLIFSELASSQTINGLTITNNKNGSITLNGTTTKEVSIRISNIMDDIIAGKYYLNRNSNGSVTGGSFQTILWVSNDTNNPIRKATLESEGKEVDIDKNYAEYYLWLYIGIGKTFTNYTLKPQLESGTQATDFAEYSKSNKIYVLNNNNVYEEFIKKESKSHSYYTGYNSIDQTVDENYTKINNFGLTLDTNGGDVLCTVSLTAKMSQNGTASAWIYLDNERIGRILTLSETIYMNYSGQYILKNITAGTHVISVYIRSDNSAYTVTIKNNSGKSFSAIEL